MTDTAPTDEQTTETTTGNPVETAEATETGASEENTIEEAAAPEGGSETETTLSHKDALAALAATRKEAASYRTKAKELEERYAEAKTPEEIEAVKAAIREESATETRNLLVENVGLAAGIPKEHHHRLVGATREELEKDAKSLSALLPAQPTEDPHLSGGLTPDEGDGVYDEAAARKRVRALRGNRR